MSDSTKRFVKSFISLMLIFVVSIAGVTLVFWLFATGDVPPPPQHRLTEASMSRRPFWSPSERGAIFLNGTGEMGGSTWLLTGVGSSTEISFRQAAVVSLQLVGNATSLPDAAEYPVDGSTVVCLEVNASAFSVNGPEDACARLAAVSTQRSILSGPPRRFVGLTGSPAKSKKRYPLVAGNEFPLLG